MIIFLALRRMVKIQCHEALNVLGWWLLQRRAMAAVGFFLLSWALFMTPHLLLSSFLRKVQSCLLRTYLSLVHENSCLFVDTLISLIYFQTLFLPPPGKGNHSKCLMSVLCLYLFLQDVVYYCVFLCVYIFQIYVNATGLHIFPVSFSFPLNTLFSKMPPCARVYI